MPRGVYDRSKLKARRPAANAADAAKTRTKAEGLEERLMRTLYTQNLWERAAHLLSGEARFGSQRAFCVAKARELRLLAASTVDAIMQQEGTR